MMFGGYIVHAGKPYLEGFRGCGLLNGPAEFPANSTGRTMGQDYKEHPQALILAELSAAMIKNAQEMAEHLALLLEGAVTRGGLRDTLEQWGTVRRMATTLLETPCAKPE